MGCTVWPLVTVPIKKNHLTQRPKDGEGVVTAVLLGLGILAFYLATMAPTVLWGDDAFFQTSAATGFLQPDGGGHWLHFVLSQLFVQLPIGDIAYRVNLLSTAAGAVTVVLVYGCGLALRLPKTAALAGTLSLAVSHTFWTHSVRAEVYTVFTMMLALVWLLLLRWRQDQPLWLYSALFLIGPSILSHQMTLLLLPAVVLFLWLRQEWLSARQWALALFAFGAGLAIAIWLIQFQVSGETVVASLTTYFTRSGADFSQAIFGFSINRIFIDTALWLGLLGLQFVGPGLILVFLGLHDWRLDFKVLLPLIFFYLTTIIFASTYRVNDSYVFFLPGYLVIGLLVGRGFQALAQKRSSLARLTLPLLVILPVLVYSMLPVALETVNLPFPNIRQLPGREPRSYFLWPAKNSYFGAAEYGRSALSTLPPASVLLADHTPYETLNYLQTVEGMRPDVTILKIEPHHDLGAVVERYEKRPVYLADENPAYYNLPSLGSATLIPFGVVHRINLES